MKSLYHSLPKELLHSTRSTDPIFIEIEPCLQDSAYFSFFASRSYLRPNTILDCGVGASPDLKNPTAHTSNDPHWAVRYLYVLMRLIPHVVVVPDVLGDAKRTRDNFIYYYGVISQLPNSTCTDLMYVIQGQNEDEAMREINWVCGQPTITWVGFPRLVHYYDHLSITRIAFVSSVLHQLRSAGKHIHLLGMNDIAELEWAASRSISVDTRMASMAAVAGIDVTAPRPSGLKIDLTQSFTPEIQASILNNINILNSIYNKTKHA